MGMLEVTLISMLAVMLAAQILRYLLFQLSPMRRIWDRFRHIPILGKFLSCPFCQGFWLGLFLIIPWLRLFTIKPTLLGVIFAIAWGLISGRIAYILQNWIGNNMDKKNIINEIDDEECDEYGDEVCLLECNIDDMSGEFFGDVMDRLFNAGAIDVWFTSAYGKKNRPLYQLSALMRQEDEDEGIRILLTHSSTAGVRRRLIKRVVMQRSFIHVNIDGESVAVKKLQWRDVTKYTPEWEDCAAASRKLNKPVAEIYAEAQGKARMV
jgi:hypothetical protein